MSAIISRERWARELAAMAREAQAKAVLAPDDCEALLLALAEAAGPHSPYRLPDARAPARRRAQKKSPAG